MESAAALLPDDRSTTPDARIRVQTARIEDKPRIGEILTAAFADDPPARWLYPDERDFCRDFPDFVRAFGGDSVELGAAYCVEGAHACALWLPPGSEADEAALVDHVVWRIATSRHDEVFEVFEALGRAHPTEPHWYLPLIGVDPAYQGRGLGSALLRLALERCDREGMPAYLEATCEDNVRLYERHGFRRLSPVRVGSCPTITPMWRAGSDRR